MVAARAGGNEEHQQEGGGLGCLENGVLSLGCGLMLTVTVRSSVELAGTESLQLFVGRESDPIRMVPQQGSEKFFLPGLPGIRILLRGPRVLGGAPEALPGLATLVDPHGGVGAAADALGAFDKVMCHKPGELQQAACFGVPESVLELLSSDPWFEVIFVNTDDA